MEPLKPQHTKIDTLFFNESEFKKYGQRMLEIICEMKKEIINQKVPVTPKIQPGDIRKLLPKEAPQNPESLDEILKDTQEIIFKNLMHWSHPSFFSYFPSNTC